MHKNIGIFIGILVLLAVIWGVTKSNDEKQKAVVDKNDVMMEDEIVNTENKSDAMVNPGTYEAYTQEKITKAASGNVVLFFRASWCPTCRSVDADIRNNLSKIPVDLTILDVDYDNSTDLKKKYGVTYQHTFVQVDKDGNLIKKWSGSPTLSALTAEIK